MNRTFWEDTGKFNAWAEKWGIRSTGGSVGEGWVPILDRLVEDLVELGWNLDLHQVKEKFGGLRFYIGEGDERMWSRIDEAETESYETCENCGAKGSLHGGGWLMTLCDACEAERQKEVK